MYLCHDRPLLKAREPTCRASGTMEGHVKLEGCSEDQEEVVSRTLNSYWQTSTYDEKSWKAGEVSTLRLSAIQLVKLSWSSLSLRRWSRNGYAFYRESVAYYATVYCCIMKPRLLSQIVYNRNHDNAKVLPGQNCHNRTLLAYMGGWVI